MNWLVHGTKKDVDSVCSQRSATDSVQSRTGAATQVFGYVLKCIALVPVSFEFSSPASKCYKILTYRNDFPEDENTRGK